MFKMFIDRSEWDAIADELVKDDKLGPPPRDACAKGSRFPVYENKIQRIKEFRDRTGAGIEESKEAIEDASLRKWNKDQYQAPLKDV
jgi:hypothetical protein